MQIGIDLGASKIESVLLDKNGKEHFRERENSPNDYIETLVSIEKIVTNIEKIKFTYNPTQGTFNCDINEDLCKDLM